MLPSDKFFRSCSELALLLNVLGVGRIPLSESSLAPLVEDAFTVVSNASSNRSEILVETELFKALVSTRITWGDTTELDEKFYRERMVTELLTGMELPIPPENSKVREWWASALETTQLPPERHRMRISLDQIPLDFYHETQDIRSEAYDLIKTRESALALISLLKGKASDDAAATNAYKIYQDKIFDKAKYQLTEVQQSAQIENLIVSWEIRARQLPIEKEVEILSLVTTKTVSSIVINMLYGTSYYQEYEAEGIFNRLQAEVVQPKKRRKDQLAITLKLRMRQLPD